MLQDTSDDGPHMARVACYISTDLVATVWLIATTISFVLTPCEKALQYRFLELLSKSRGEA